MDSQLESAYPTTLLATKVSPPRMPAALTPRPHLTAYLNRGMRTRLTLISASAGFGKTTLLAEWLGQSNRKAAWYALDESDNDPARFLTYLVSALRVLHPRLGESILPGIASAQPPTFENLLTNLINDISALPQDLALVLDDYHVITRAEVHQALSFLIENQPDRLHLFIATRADPPLPLARLRANGQLTELRAADLRFRLDDAQHYLSTAMNLQLTGQQLETLENRTEGWIAGLQLAALSLQKQHDPTRFITDFSGTNRYILDYLTDEVLNRLPASSLKFLLQTSILERLTASLCNTVCQMTGAQQQLEQLEEENLFLIPLDDHRQWYRYHHLFVQLLRAHLQEQYPAEISELHLRAARWHLQHHLDESAIFHFLAAGDLPSAARVIENRAIELLYRGEMSTLAAWLEKIPPANRPDFPWLDVFEAWIKLLTGQLPAQETLLQRAELNITSASPDTHSQLRGHAAAIRAYAAAFQSNPDLVLQSARQALELLPAQDAGIRAVAQFTIGIAHGISGEIIESQQAFYRAGRMAADAGNLHMAIPALSASANQLAAIGQLRDAHTLFSEALQLCRVSEGVYLPLAARVLSSFSMLLYEWNQLNQAAEYALQALELSKIWGNADVLARNPAALARIQIALGNLTLADQYLIEAEQLLAQRKISPTIPLVINETRVQYWLAANDWVPALRWLQTCGYSLRDEVTFQNLAGLLTYARVVLTRATIQDNQAELQSVQQLLHRITLNAAAGNRGALFLNAALLESLAFSALRQEAQAQQSLLRALAWAEPEGFLRSILDLGEPILQLLEQLRAQIDPSVSDADLPSATYLDLLLTSAGRASDVPPMPDQNGLVEPLSERELQVLQQIAAGQSNQEIADRLFISLRTVKSHANHIFGKLGVKNRTQAVARARELELL